MRSLALLLCLPLSACVSVIDDDSSLSDGSRLPSTLPADAQAMPATMNVPSISNLSRDHWPQSHFSVPQREITHQPVYRSRPVLLTDATSLQRGEYPDHPTAGEMPMGRSDGDQRLEALAAPFVAVGEVLLMIPRAIMLPPTTPVRSPSVPVERIQPARSEPPLIAVPPTPPGGAAQ